MNWKEEFIKLLEARTFKTNSEIEDYADEHNLPVADVWQCFAEYRDDCLIKQSIEKIKKCQTMYFRVVN